MCRRTLPVLGDGARRVESGPMGPLEGISVVELAAIGPVPVCGMLLAELGADGVRVDRVAEASGGLPGTLTQIGGRSRRSIAVDLKTPEGRAVVLRLVARSDVLLEGFRPGVMERLGLGPDVCAEHNPGLVYGRMTGWGREGPMADMAGHDINYIGLVGALHAIGPADHPVPPLNLVGDYGGGALYLAFGVLAALLERNVSGKGQVVDAAMIDGAASLMTPIFQLSGVGGWHEERQANLLDGGAPFYRTYRTADDRWMAVGALEPQFYAELLAGLDLDPGELPAQMDVEHWPDLHERFAAVFSTRSRDEWQAVFDGRDACVTPVLDMEEAPLHPHNQVRGVFITVDGMTQPGPAPRFDRTPAAEPTGAPRPGEHSDEILAGLGYPAAERDALIADGVVI